MMSRLLPGALLAASLTLGGCTMLDGYGGMSVGYGDGYDGGYDPYYDGYQPSYYGWYDDYYYPGAGYYVYDRGGARHRWSDRHRRYWEQRRGRDQAGENWSGYRRDGRWDGRRDGRDDRDHDNRGPNDRQREWRRGQGGALPPGMEEAARVLGARPAQGRPERGPRRDWAPGGERPAAPGVTSGRPQGDRSDRAPPRPEARAPAPERAEQPVSQPRERAPRAAQSNPDVRDE